MLARLQQAYDDPSTPDQATLYALHNLNPTIRDRGNEQARFCSNYGRLTGRTYEESLARWRELENSIDRSRSAADPETFTNDNRARARQLGLPQDPGSVHAMASMDDEIEIHEIMESANSVQRIDRSPSDIPVDNTRSITEYGYDPRSERLEVVVHDSAGTEHVYAYRNVSAEDYSAARVSDAHFASWWSEDIHGNHAHAYESPRAAAEAGRAPRCQVCGQFANSSHSCPVIPDPTVFSAYDGRWTRQEIEIPDRSDEGHQRQYRYRLPGAMRMREAFHSGPIRIPLSEWFHEYSTDEDGNRQYQHVRMNGSVLTYRTDDGEMAFNVAEMNCSCREYQDNGTCRHIDAATLSIRRRLVPPQRRPLSSLTPAERAERQAEADRRAAERAAAAEQAASSDWTRNEETFAEARRTWNTRSEVLYSEDTESFYTTYTAAAERAAASDTPDIPYQRENALDGMATRGSGQAFGVEIEYDFPNSMSYHERREANSRIGRELYEAGLASDHSQLGYAASRRSGYRDTHINPDGSSNWSFERDGSVGGGELVTPPMYDEPETWERLETAVAILKRNGAVASKKAGAHVHVGTGFFQGDVAKYTELARLMTQHEDVMLRIASDPNRGTHRNNGYTAPLSAVPAEGFSDVSQAKRWQGSRTKALNLASVASAGQDPSKDHVEFRVFDASLDAGTLQAQIKTAVSMTNAAARIAQDAPTQRTKEPAGSHAERAKARGRRRLTKDDVIEDTATFRSLLDTLFTRKADKDQLIALFARNKWTTKRRR